VHVYAWQAAVPPIENGSCGMGAVGY